jgi:hypothetical protein
VNPAGAGILNRIVVDLALRTQTLLLPTLFLRIISSAGSRLLGRRRGGLPDTGRLRSTITYGSRPGRRSRSYKTGSSGVRIGR